MPSAPDFTIVTLEYPPFRGGAGVYCEQLAQGISRCGSMVEVIAPRYQEQESGEGGTFRVRRPGSTDIALLLVTAARLFQRPSTHLILGDLGVYLALARLPGLPREIYSTVVHGTEIGMATGSFPSPLSVDERRQLLSLLAGSRRVLSSNRAAAETLVRFLPGSAPAPVIVPPTATSTGRRVGEAVTLRQRLGIGASPMIVCVARLGVDKGQDVLIEALPSVSERVPGSKLVLVGDGPLRSDLDDLVRRLGIRESVVFAGSVSRGELAAYYEAADVFAMISRSRARFEGFGIVFLEAALHGCPSVGGRSGGVPEAIVNNVTGWLVDPESPVDVAEVLVRVLSNHEMRRLAGQAAYERARREYSPDKMTQRLGVFVEEVTPDSDVPDRKTIREIRGWAVRATAILAVRSLRRIVASSRLGRSVRYLRSANPTQGR